MNKIIQGYMQDFLEEQGLQGISQNLAFEKFINYCLVTRFHPDPFELEDICVGEGGTLGLDGLAIFVNDHLVKSIDEVNYFRKNYKHFDIKFVFIQAKSSEHFDFGDMSKFFYAVKTFFTSENGYTINEKLDNLKKVEKNIFDNSSEMAQNPVCLLYYVTTGSWNKENNQLNDLIVDSKTQLDKLRIFSQVAIHPIDSDQIQIIYREIKHKIEREIVIQRVTTMPSISEISEAYLGVIPCKEYLKLISDKEGNIIKSLFYSNVRDYQGSNAVNVEIRETIQNNDEKIRFVLLNNGITIVANTVNRTVDKFKISDFQIVNGCQTSHELFLNRSNIDDSMYIPIRIIVTSNAEVTSHITKATNRQTEVKIEAFESLSNFHKKLEEFYKQVDKDKDNRILYERRSKQYEYEPIKKYRIISLAKQINCFLAMFLEEPHSTHRYYGEILENYRYRLFQDDHNLFPYYICSFALCKIEEYFRLGHIDKKYLKFRYHMIFILRFFITGINLPKLNSKQIEKECETILSLLRNDDELKDLISKITILLEDCLKGIKGDYSLFEATRRKAFTNEIINAYKIISKSKERKTPERIHRKGSYKGLFNGIVMNYDTYRGFGFIRTKDNDDLFVHCTAIRNTGYLIKGQRVRCNIKNTERGLQAINVYVIYNQ